jgi:hypothetical protein
LQNLDLHRLAIEQVGEIGQTFDQIVCTEVPLRLPWTLCLRERLPPRSVAVLINRAHTYPDLALPIDAAQEQILAAIDGRRSIDEIANAASVGGDERARRFIEQLWQYDQIVFDATSSFTLATCAWLC